MLKKCFCLILAMIFATITLFSCDLPTWEDQKENEQTDLKTSTDDGKESETKTSTDDEKETEPAESALPNDRLLSIDEFIKGSENMTEASLEKMRQTVTIIAPTDEMIHPVSDTISVEFGRYWYYPYQGGWQQDYHISESSLMAWIRVLKTDESGAFQLPYQYVAVTLDIPEELVSLCNKLGLNNPSGLTVTLKDRDTSFRDGRLVYHVSDITYTLKIHQPTPTDAATATGSFFDYMEWIYRTVTFPYANDDTEKWEEAPHRYYYTLNVSLFEIQQWMDENGNITVPESFSDRIVEHSDGDVSL